MTRQEAIEWLEDEKDEYLAKLGTNTEAYDMAIEALEENPFEVVYDFFSEYVFHCNDDLVDSPNDYYAGIFDLMTRIKEKADEVDASVLGGNNIYEK